MKTAENARKKLIFVLIASALMGLVYFGIPALKASFEPAPQSPVAEDPEVQSYFYYEENLSPPEPLINLDNESLASVEHSFAEIEKQPKTMGPHKPPFIGEAPAKPSEKIATPYKPALTRPEYQAPVKVVGHPKIAIIIDDMGMDRKRSRIMAQMDEKLTLAVLPYAPDLQSLTKLAKDHNHELMIHMPMQAVDTHLNLGTIALRSGMDQDEINAELDKAFASFDGYVGLNNHMGSKLTQDPQAMNWVMQRLKEKGLYFIDSVTIGNSVAASVARDYGLQTGQRDVFLDHVDSVEAVRTALHRLEVVANKQGYAIAIGHPRAATITALQEWLPLAREKGYEFVYASALVQKPKTSAVTSLAPAQSQFQPRE